MQALFHSSLLKPPALQPGAQVAIVAPASNLKLEYLQRGVAELAALGFCATHRPDILAKGRYTAGSDERRADELIDALLDPNIQAVWAARGGYGVMRLLPMLAARLPAHLPPKVLIGYSDLTALQLFLARRYNWVTFHGPMAAKDLAGGTAHYDRTTLLNALTRTEPMGEIRHEKLTTLSSGPVVSGRLMGGCMSLLVALLGTPAELDTRDTILFIEDTGVKPYALDRMWQQLKLAGKLNGVRGIIFGEMTDCMQHAEQGYTLTEVLSELTADLGIPVLFGLPSGHSPLGNMTLPLGVQVTLDAANCELRIEEAAVL